jgi:ubiquinone/menaquinone biosynthesis C-methylase UbiE
VTAGDSLLDVGGGLGIVEEFQRLYGSFGTVVIANLRTDSNGPIHAHVRLVAADGCALPFESCAFDWVFSNAVIEHVGSWEKQKQFAQEVRRVAKKGYFVATPNRHFPVEPHTLLPFYQFMPPGLQRAALRLSPGYLTEYTEIHLLSARQLGALFPEAQTLKTGLPGLPNVLVAFYRSTP